ncbi:hypothetical protein GTY86_15545 [Streptomyces sp. SID5770]|uniref:hypothetical protein n=1 Tax=Streptomyces sp. SID5770 TaxID=2690308 RepID=UPI00136FAE2D|nr:hypothetical protein [Streptomyces sp. SID5770]MZE52673.1 hypothetical protein [Streptomyces sp. SID5770]
MSSSPPPDASGARPTRRSGRWERYRVARPFSARDRAGLWGAIVGVVALALLLGRALDLKGGVVIVAAVPFVIGWYENRRTAFQFDAAGARFGTALLPWSDVPQSVAAEPAHVAVPRAEFDLARTVRKARSYAPPHVRIVVADLSGERTAH